jgi:ferredoxin--NADP+ reductase
MHTMVDKKDLNSEDYLVRIKAPFVARKWKPGNFVVLRLHDKGERVPMSVQKVDGDTITIFVKRLGKTSHELDSYKAGDAIKDVIGPLGNPAEVKKYGRVIVASDLVCGHAENYAISKALRERGNYVISLQGFPTKSMVYLEEELKGVSDEYYLSTEDGSCGRRGLLTDMLKELLRKDRVDMVFAGGTFPGLKRIADITRSFDVPAMVTLRTLMVDATGMCGSCRVFIDGKMKLACVDGPIFDAHKVDFDEVIKRNGMFKEEEAIALEKYRGGLR